jgi:hypothetical protein
MVNKLWELMQQYNPRKVLIDGSNPEWIKELKIQIGEEPDYLEVIRRMKKNNFDYIALMKVLPINFSENGKYMLGHAKMMLEKGNIEIHSKFEKLVAALGSATDKGEGNVDKEEMAYPDVFDAFRLALFYFKTGRKTNYYIISCLADDNGRGSSELI